MGGLFLLCYGHTHPALLLATSSRLFHREGGVFFLIICTAEYVKGRVHFAQGGCVVYVCMGSGSVNEFACLTETVPKA